MSGFSAWLLQRLTALYMLVFIIITAIVLTVNPVDIHLWQQWFKTLWIQLSVLLFAFSVLIHAWVGLRDVILDYVKPLGWRLIGLTLAALFLIINGLWLILVLGGDF